MSKQKFMFYYYFKSHSFSSLFSKLRNYQSSTLFNSIAYNNHDVMHHIRNVINCAGLIQKRDDIDQLLCILQGSAEGLNSFLIT